LNFGSSHKRKPAISLNYKLYDILHNYMNQNFGLQCEYYVDQLENYPKVSLKKKNTNILIYKY